MATPHPPAAIDRQPAFQAFQARSLPGQHILLTVNQSSSPKDIAVPTDDTVLSGLTHAIPLLADGSVAAFTPATLTLQLRPQAAIVLQVE